VHAAAAVRGVVRQQNLVDCKRGGQQSSAAAAGASAVAGHDATRDNEPGASGAAQRGGAAENASGVTQEDYTVEARACSALFRHNHAQEI
jgi:hypothetical protein